MAGCPNELSNLAPVISSCPGSNELLLFCNVSGQQGGYAFRSWATVRACLSALIEFDTLQFVVGQFGAPMTVGQTTLVIDQENLILGSVFITLSGTEIPQNDGTQISYIPTYGDNMVSIVFNQGVQDLQQYIIHFAFIN